MSTAVLIFSRATPDKPPPPPCAYCPHTSPIHSQEGVCTSAPRWKRLSCWGCERWMALGDWYFLTWALLFLLSLDYKHPKSMIILYILQMRKVKVGTRGDRPRQHPVLKTSREVSPTPPWTNPEELRFTSHRRSLVKISSLARSSWFHSSRSFSCPFQLSLSCSLVLKAVGGRGKTSTHQKKESRSHPTANYPSHL